MSPEVCPFCGKSFKRLKSHLPYCKAAKIPLSHHEPMVSSPPGQLEADSFKIKGKKTPQLNKKTSPEAPGKSGHMSPQVKPKKKSIRATIEAAKSSQTSPGTDSAPQSLETVPSRSASTKSKSSAESQKPKSASKGKQIKCPEKEMAVGKEMPRITVQHVGSTLGRAKTNRPSIETTQTNTKSGLSPASFNIMIQHKNSLLTLKDNVSGSKATSYKPSILPDLKTSKVGFQQTEFTSVLPGHLSNFQSKTVDTAATIEMRKNNLSGRSLGQVTLRELPEWLACKTPRCPGDAAEMMLRGWQWYYRKYIDVRKGGVGGIGMLLAGYCMLGYVWSYPHLSMYTYEHLSLYSVTFWVKVFNCFVFIEHERWRKYH
ncbi:mitochondrial nucleoid-associated protein 1 isoform X2 [Syngnathus scovelli]|uniref:mitochondrial nucleoid-associated protein 1 isoform X2 n=1 Tax=Syngnathus scovelli TaxID=161590 RepID=UPI0021105573|nr:uncharacterized protein C17orf80 isoform X2 [Syngnathus scovelli]